MKNKLSIAAFALGGISYIVSFFYQLASLISLISAYKDKTMPGIIVATIITEMLILLICITGIVLLFLHLSVMARANIKYYRKRSYLAIVSIVFLAVFLFCTLVDIILLQSLNSYILLLDAILAIISLVFIISDFYGNRQILSELRIKQKENRVKNGLENENNETDQDKNTDD